MNDEGILTAMSEKILVDIVAEPDLFQAQQGELEDILTLLFRNCPSINPKCCAMPVGAENNKRLNN